MTDEDNDYRGSKRGTRTSFKGVGDSVMGMQEVREGKRLTSGKSSKRKSVMGVRPKNSIVEPDDTEKELGSSAYNKTKKKKSSYYDNENDNKNEYEGVTMQKGDFQKDILTRQAIDEIKDNIKLFKMDIEKYITELRDEQDKIQIGEIRKQIQNLAEGVEKDMQKTRGQDEKDFDDIKEEFYKFRDEVFAMIDNVAKDNEDKIEGLYNEIKNYEAAVNKKFKDIEDKQEEYMNILKEILNKTNDPKIRELVRRFLVDDEE